MMETMMAPGNGIINAPVAVLDYHEFNTTAGDVIGRYTPDTKAEDVQAGFIRGWQGLRNRIPPGLRSRVPEGKSINRRLDLKYEAASQMRERLLDEPEVIIQKYKQNRNLVVGGYVTGDGNGRVFTIGILGREKLKAQKRIKEIDLRLKAYHVEEDAYKANLIDGNVAGKNIHIGESQRVADFRGRERALVNSKIALEEEVKKHKAAYNKFWSDHKEIHDETRARYEGLAKLKHFIDTHPNIHGDQEITLTGDLRLTAHDLLANNRIQINTASKNAFSEDLDLAIDALPHYFRSFYKIVHGSQIRGKVDLGLYTLQEELARRNVIFDEDKKKLSYQVKGAISAQDKWRLQERARTTIGVGDDTSVSRDSIRNEAEEKNKLETRVKFIDEVTNYFRNNYLPRENEIENFQKEIRNAAEKMVEVNELATRTKKALVDEIQSSDPILSVAFRYDQMDAAHVDAQFAKARHYWGQMRKEWEGRMQEYLNPRFRILHEGNTPSVLLEAINYVNNPEAAVPTPKDELIIEIAKILMGDASVDSTFNKMEVERLFPKLRDVEKDEMIRTVLQDRNILCAPEMVQTILEHKIVSADDMNMAVVNILKYEDIPPINKEVKEEILLRTDEVVKLFHENTSINTSIEEELDKIKKDQMRKIRPPLESTQYAEIFAEYALIELQSTILTDSADKSLIPVYSRMFVNFTRDIRSPASLPRAE